jgi:hypothetical protein
MSEVTILATHLNGDGVNDTWMIYNIENYLITPLEFSTDGVLKYSLQGYQNDWNGFYKTVTSLFQIQDHTLPNRFRW